MSYVLPHGKQSYQSNKILTAAEMNDLADNQADIAKYLDGLSVPTVSNAAVNIKDAENSSIGSFTLNKSTATDVVFPTASSASLGLTKVDASVTSTSNNPVSSKGVKAAIDSAVSNGVGKGVYKLQDKDTNSIGSINVNSSTDAVITLPTSGDGKLGLVKTDSVIDASSANPVQNKVVKAYVDKTVSDGVGKGNKTVQDADGNVLFVIDANDKTVTTSTIPNATATKPGLIYANPAGGWSSKKDEAAIVRSADGVMEIGQLIDFHRAKDDTKDYATRLKLNGDNGNQVDLPAASGTLALTSDIKNNKVTVKDANAVSIGDFTVNQSSDKTITIPRASGTALGMVKLVASTTDIGEGSPLEAGTIYGVYTA